MKQRFYSVVGVILILLLSSTLAIALEGFTPPTRDDSVPGELIIGFKPEATLTQVNQVISRVNGKLLKHFNAPRGRIARVKLPSTDPSAIDSAIGTLQSDPAFGNLIRYVEPNYINYLHQSRPPSGDAGILAQSGDPLLGYQWGYFNISANWPNAMPSGSGVTVAVLDTGVDYNHPDLLKKVIKGYDWVNGDKDPMDDHGHGTHVSGIIAAIANNNYGIAGVSWNAKIYAIKVLSTQGWGTDFDVALGIYEAANNSSVQVINMSLGGPASTTNYDAVYYAVMTRGKLLVASAGNSNTNVKSYPAGYSTDFPGRVLAVAAHGSDNCRASFSNYGTWVSITAPGVDILSTLPNSLGTNGFASWNGTSMAAPFVAGAAALAWEKNPSYTNTQIANLITTNTSLPYAPLLRNGTCWPNDGSTFQRLDVLHILEQQYYEACNNYGAIYGYSFDAETGLPLAGGLVTTSQGGTDYVSFYGKRTFFGDDVVAASHYGIFNVLTGLGANNLTITKKNYMTFTPKDQSGTVQTLPVNACFWTYAGNIPVPPKKKDYWLAVTWNYGYTAAGYNLYMEFYLYGTYQGYIGWDYPGSVNTYPFVKHLWDSDSTSANSGAGTLRNYAETIRISKLTSGGGYLFYVDDWWNGSGSTNWVASGIKAYLYRGSTLVKTYTPPAGSGRYWVICDIVGSTIYDYNYLTN